MCMFMIVGEMVSLILSNNSQSRNEVRGEVARAVVLTPPSPARKASRVAEGAGHRHRVACHSDGRIHEHSVCTHLHSGSSMGRSAQTGIYDHGHRALLDDNLEHIAGDEAFVGADRRAERHHGR